MDLAVQQNRLLYSKSFSCTAESFAVQQMILPCWKIISRKEKVPAGRQKKFLSLIH
jgi:hypothetical protein